MHDFRPHSFDTRAFFFCLKCLIGIVMLCVAVKFGTAFAFEHVARPETALAATAAATAPEPTVSSSVPLSPSTPSLQKIPMPNVTAKAFLIADMKSGTIFATQDAHTPYPIASISKLLTALTAREIFASTTTISITNEDRRNTEGSPGSIGRTESFAALDLFYPLLMESNNAVANAFARTYGKEEFVRVMLRRAHAIGMDETLLHDPSGLSAQNSASADDLFKLTRTVFTEAPEFFEITRTPAHTITATSGKTYSFPNFNVFAKDAHFLGGKTGYTDEAKQTMIALFEEDGVQIAIIVLHSSDRKKDIEKLRAWFARAPAHQ